jgi:hypothetical protein
VAQQTNRSLHGFETQTKKPTTGFEAKPGETVATGFEAKPVKITAASFEGKPLEIVRVVLGQTTHKPLTLILRLNQETHAPSRHVPSADLTWRHPTSRLSDHQVPNLCDYPLSSASGLLLLPRSSSLHVIPHLPPTHHDTSKRDSLNETKIKEKQNKTIPDSNSNLARSMTRHNQTKELTTSFLNLPFDESIDNKSTKFEV